MKRLVLILGLLAPALNCMEKEAPKNLPTKVETVAYLKKYVNIKQLLFSMGNMFVSDEKDSSDSDSGSEESEKTQDTISNDTIRQLMNAFINALKLDKIVLTIEVPNKSSNDAAQEAIVATKTKRIKLQRICDLVKFRKLLIEINDNNFGKGHAKANYSADLVDCIKWTSLQKNLGLGDDEYTVLKGAADAIVEYSKNGAQGIDITKYVHIQKIVKLLFGFDIETYADLPLLNELVDTAFKREQISPETAIACLKLEPFLLLFGCAEEDVEAMSAILKGFLLLAYDFSQDEESALTDLMGTAALYRQIKMEGEDSKEAETI